jgi:hypothetical protein
MYTNPRVTLMGYTVKWYQREFPGPIAVGKSEGATEGGVDRQLTAVITPSVVFSLPLRTHLSPSVVVIG